MKLPTKFDWDEQNIRHIARHKVTPAEFEEAMRNSPVFGRVDDESGEERWYAVGATNGLRVLGLVFTYQRNEVRPVTAWDASREAREYYFRTVGESDG